MGFVFLLAGCAQPTPTSAPVKNVTASALPTITASPTVQSTPILLPTEEVAFYSLETSNGKQKIYPNLWTNIAPSKIQSYTFSYPIQSATGKDGSTWYIGYFGVIWQKPDGSQTLFSNEQPNPYGFPTGGDFRLVTVGPDGQVWVGGRNKILFRFDGKKWINEGENIPDMPGNPSWLCYSKNVVGVDFDQIGSTWILTAEMEIYHLVKGQWINLPTRIPDKFMPFGGGRACPDGIKVYSPNNIIVKRGGCCESPDIGIHFDGNNWEKTDKLEDVETLFMWADYPHTKHINNKLVAIMAIHEKDKTMRVVPFFSWLSPPQGTYLVQKNDSAIYITNQNVSENEMLIAKFDKKTQTWKSFLFKNFDKNLLCAAHIDEEGDIWLQFNCFNYDSDGNLLPLQNNLYRLSPNIFDDYKSPQPTP